MEEKPGYGFRPYDEELVGYYLRNKILGNTSLVEGDISEVKICSCDPWDLRFKSKIKSRDPAWYFFSLRENKYSNGNRQSRRTPSGFWKLTGESVDVKDQWGIWCGIRGKIGHKRVLVFLKGKSSENTKSDWVMHELHYTLLPEDKRTHVICRLEYKGDDINILSANATDPTPTFGANGTNSAGSVVDHSLQWNPGTYYNFSEYDSAHQIQWFTDDFNMQQQAPYSAPYGDESQMIWDREVRENLEFLIDERTFMQDHRSNHQPKKPLTGVFSDDCSESDTDSTICRDSPSSNDSVGSSNGPYPTPIDLSSSTTEPLHSYGQQEQPKLLKLQLQGKEKVVSNTEKSECEWKMAEDSVKKAPVKQRWIVLEEISRRNSQWIYLTHIIIGLLLFISIIGWIILFG